MDFKFYLAFTCLLCIFLCVNQVSCLMCHTCSTKNENQEDCISITAESTKYLQNCTAPKDRSCRVQIQWIDFDILDRTRDRHVIRQCASSAFDPETVCFYRTGNMGRMSICNCIGDGCNEASRNVTTISMTLIIFMLMRYFTQKIITL